MLDITKTYYKNTKGFFDTQKTDLQFLAQCLAQATKSGADNLPKIKYTQAQVARIIKMCESASAFYFSSANLIFYIKDKKIYITKAGRKFTSDICALFNISPDALYWDTSIDDIYTTTRAAKNTPALSVDDVRAFLA